MFEFAKSVPLLPTIRYAEYARGLIPHSIQSVRIEFGSPHSLTSKGVLLSTPFLGPRGETHSLAGKAVGGPNSDGGTDTLHGFLCIQ
jgi:hypothetical protein